MHIFFDLDGTLIDSYPGIEKAFKSTIEELNCKIRPNFKLRTQIGKPLYNIFYEATKSKRISQTAIPIFRNNYGKHYLYEFTLYNQAKQTLDNFIKQGHHLYIVTNKAAVFAEQMIKIAGLHHYFVSIKGPEINQSLKKIELIHELTRENPLINSQNCIMIGDTINDYDAVAHLNIPVYILLHGYGKKSDFVGKDITGFCEDFNELYSSITQRYVCL